MILVYLVPSILEQLSCGVSIRDGASNTNLKMRGSFIRCLLGVRGVYLIEGIC